MEMICRKYAVSHGKMHVLDELANSQTAYRKLHIVSTCFPLNLEAAYAAAYAKGTRHQSTIQLHSVDGAFQGGGRAENLLRMPERINPMADGQSFGSRPILMIRRYP